eukprot:SAG31_NODE_2005_length_6679_cov_3.467021_3_plen_68_part_00
MEVQYTRDTPGGGTGSPSSWSKTPAHETAETVHFNVRLTPASGQDENEIVRNYVFEYAERRNLACGE